MQLTDYISAGYFITTPVCRPGYVAPKLMPERFFSLSGCLSDFFPGAWTLEWCGTGEREQARIAEILGIDAEHRRLATAELDDALGQTFGWESVLYSLEVAREYRARYFSSNSQARIIGAALHRDCVEEFLAAGAPPPPKPGESPFGMNGTVEVASKRMPPAAGGTVLGFEPMAFDQGQLTCSWLCNSLETVCAEKLAIRPNASGYLGSEEEAARCVALINDDATGAEPGLWLPWLLIEYPQ